MFSGYELRGRLFGLIASLVVLVSITAICTWLWTYHSAPLLEIAKDRFSLSFVLALLILLYLLLIALRAAHEPQYGMYLFGRAQEVIFLRQVGILVAPFIVMASLGISYGIERWQLPLSLVGWLAAFCAVIGFIKDITGAWLRPIELERFFLLPTVQPEAGKKLLTESSIKPPEDCRQLMPTWQGRVLCVPTTTDWEVLNGFLISPKVNLALQNSNSVLSKRELKRLATAYKLPESLLNFRETALIHTRAKGGLLHNESKIRLCDDLFRNLDTTTSRPIEIQKTSYYLSVCSNELTGFEIIPRDGASRTGTDLFNYVRLAPSGMVIDLKNSQLSNHLGGGTLGITRQGKIFLNKQGRLNVVSPGLLVPSGSGSFDWKDQRRATDLSTLVKTGLERELIEECGLAPANIGKTIVLGMGRDLARGGKPEFFGVTLLIENDQVVQPSIKVAEVGFVDLHDDIDLVLGKPEHIVEQLEKWLDKNHARCSTTLVLNLRLLIAASPEVHAEIFSHLNA
jgi:hypothetical protein